MKIIVNPIWECQLQCPYCWVRALGWHGDPTQLYWKVWAKWLLQLPPFSIVDFVGGEPTLYPGLPKLVGVLGQAGIGWAITTNLIRMEVVEQMLEHPGCVVVNVSIHPDSPRDVRKRIARLRRNGHLIRVSRVLHKDAPTVNWAGDWLAEISYMDVDDGMVVDGKHRLCSAGVKHLVCDPSGNVYRCATHMQLGLAPLGNIGTPPLELVLDGASPCSSGCTICYTEDPSVWEIEMWPR